MIDFSALPRKNKAYAGANGSKISVIYNDEQYMLKFPPAPTKNQNISYTNSCISEYLGCQIFASVGIPVQDTLLGTYRVGNKEKVVVACKDFTSAGIVLQDFASMKNQIIDSVRNGYGTELSDILTTIDSQIAVDRSLLTERFWDMFIIDALIGNWDRHNGNWGFLYNAFNDTLELAPVYDCGSSLFPQADEEMMQTILSSRNEINHRIFDIPTSAIQINGKKINYFQFITSMKNEDCNRALWRIHPKIDLIKINQLIDDIPVLGDLQKSFYKTMIRARKDRILDQTMKRLSVREYLNSLSSSRKNAHELATSPPSAPLQNEQQTPDFFFDWEP